MGRCGRCGAEEYPPTSENGTGAKHMADQSPGKETLEQVACSHVISHALMVSFLEGGSKQLPAGPICNF